MPSGYAYVSERRDPLWSAHPGDRVRTPSLGPPYIVVDHALEGVVVPRWPGWLLRVRIVPAANRREREAFALAHENLRDDAGYTRALAVEVLEELDPAALFGTYGAVVTRMLDAALELNTDDLDGPLGSLDPRAAHAYDDAWKRWLASGRSSAPPRDGDYTGVVADPNAGPTQSPIGNGLLVLAATITARGARSPRPPHPTPSTADGRCLERLPARLAVVSVHARR